VKIVFFGTPPFAKTILEYLYERAIEIAAVVTRPDQPKGRSGTPVPTAVKQFALAHHLPLYQPKKASDEAFASFLQTLDADYFVVAAYAEILKENVLNIPRIGCINVHGSILPKFRGAAPVQRAIMAGEKETGVTIMKMAPQMDAGDILAVRKTDIPLDMTSGELMQVLADIGKSALLEVLQGLEKGSIQPMQQKSEAATFAKKLTIHEGEIDWSKPCEVVHNQIRGVTPNPGAWCMVEYKGEKKRLLVKKSKPDPTKSGMPGEIISKNFAEFHVACDQGSVMLLELQLEGKKPMTAEAFLRGIQLSFLKMLPKKSAL
jgi:methionyl-tRNA formyltransferase